MKLAIVMLLACGAPDFSAYPATRCGLHFEGISSDELQQIEDATVASFQSSPDLRDVCAAVNGWKLEVTSAPIVPGGDVLDDPDPTQPVAGVTIPNQWTIRVISARFIFPHEAAHVAQGCTRESGLHTGWWNVCTGSLAGKACLCDNGVDQLGNPCTPGLVQPELIDARSRIDAALGP